MQQELNLVSKPEIISPFEIQYAISVADSLAVTIEEEAKVEISRKRKGWREKQKSHDQAVAKLIEQFTHYRECILYSLDCYATPDLIDELGMTIHKIWFAEVPA